MKKLTDKDTILCVSIEEAIDIRDKFNIEIENKYLKDGFKKNIEICIYQDNCFSSKRYAKENGFKITKASKILNKGVSKKELLRRIEKLENFMIDNTEVTVSKTTEIEGIKTEIPKITEVQVDCSELTKEQIQELADIVVENGFTIWDYQKPLNTYLEKWHIFFRKITEPDESVNDNDFGIFTHPNEESKNITYQKFKDLYSKPKEEEKPLSIREVQVKVNSQEEANECAEIAKACGEKVDNIIVTEKFNIFRLDVHCDSFFVSSIKKVKFPEISIQEFRERFGKPKEIDWSKAGQYVINKNNAVWRTTGNQRWELDVKINYQ